LVDFRFHSHYYCIAMTRNILMLFVIIATISNNAFSQAAEGRDVSDLTISERIFFGGFLGLQFGTQTAINISPQAGFLISNRFSAGIGSTYQLYHDRFFGQSFTTHVFGYSVFGRLHIMPRIFAHAEFEQLNMQIRENRVLDQPDERFWETNIFLGAGYRQPLSDRVNFNIMLLYNFNEQSQAYYQNPIFRFGVDVSLR